MTLDEIAAHLATVRPNGSFDCAYRNGYAQALLPGARLVFGKLLLDAGPMRVLMEAHVWLELDGGIVDFSWSTFSRQFEGWSGPMVDVMTGPMLVAGLYCYIEDSSMDASQFDSTVKEAQLDAHDYQRSYRPAVSGAPRVA